MLLILYFYVWFFDFFTCQRQYKFLAPPLLRSMFLIVVFGCRKANPWLVSIYPQLELQYLHNHAAINSGIGLNPAPLLEVSAVIGDKTLGLGGEVAFDTASALFTKYNAGISFSKPDFSAALILYVLTIPHFVCFQCLFSLF